MENLTTEQHTKYIIITGNTVAGFEFYGTFRSEIEAIEFANTDAHLPEDWHIAPVYTINKVKGL